MKRITFLLLFIVVLWSGYTESKDYGSLEELSGSMTGSFSSSEQAAMDSAFFDIRLQMVRIWPGKENGQWLYVEQAAASRSEQPYRQRIYHITQQDDSTFQSSVFEFSVPMRYTGAWRNPERFSNLNPDSLIEREGCAILLRKVGNAYAGSTIRKECLSTHRGAAYATSEVVIEPDRMVTWDRGFDEKDEQVWGAIKGGYIFSKLADY